MLCSTFQNHRCFVSPLFNSPAFKRPSRTQISKTRLQRVYNKPDKSESFSSPSGSSVPQEVSKEEWKWVDSSDARWAHGILFSILMLGSLPVAYNYEFSQVPYFLSIATLTIYIGSHRSLSSSELEPISFSQTLLAPVFASMGLFGVYLLIKNFGGAALQVIIDVQFGIVGTYAIGRLLAPFIKQLPISEPLDKWAKSLSPPNEDGDSDSDSSFELFGAFIGAICILSNILTGHRIHTLNNFIVCAIVIELLQIVGTRSFKAAFALLSGFVIYDVFWVFFSPDVIGENVMLKVATSDVIEGPLKLLLPNGDTQGYGFSVLGLGDIAVPGLLAGLLLRFDAFGQNLSEQEDASKPDVGEWILKSRKYFVPVLVSYVAGLLLAATANIVTHEGQPALLHIVPCMLITTIGLAGFRGELWNRLVTYKDPIELSVQRVEPNLKTSKTSSME